MYCFVSTHVVHVTLIQSSGVTGERMKKDFHVSRYAPNLTVSLSTRLRNLLIADKWLANSSLATKFCVIWFVFSFSVLFRMRVRM